MYLFIFCFMPLISNTFYIHNLESSSLKPIQDWLALNNGTCTIYVTPQVGFSSYITRCYAWFNYKKNKYLQETKMYGVWIGASITCMSYLSVLYTIYRAYTVIIKIKDIIQLFDIQDEEPLELFVRTRYKYSGKKIFQNYENTLLLYVRVHKLLKKMHIRWMFPYQKEAHKNIVLYSALVQRIRNIKSR